MDKPHIFSDRIPYYDINEGVQVLKLYSICRSMAIAVQGSFIFNRVVVIIHHQLSRVDFLCERVNG